MRSRKFRGGGRSSARQKSRTCRADQEAELCPTRTACLVASHKSDKCSLKNIKHEKSSLVKADLQDLVCESRDSAYPHAVHPAEGNMTTGEKEKIIPKRKSSTSVTRPVQMGNSCLPETENLLSGNMNKCFDHPSFGQRAMEDNSGDGSVLLNVTNLENREVLKTPLQLDTSAFLDDDSNQPMPLGRFFENADLMQDIPPVVPSHSSMSRREFRKLHFKAKEEEEEEEDIGEDL